MTYDLRRLRLHGMIQRIPETHRNRVTDFSLRAALYFTRVHARLYRPAVAQVLSYSNGPPLPSALQRGFQKLETQIDQQIQQARLAAPDNLTLLHQLLKVKPPRLVSSGARLTRLGERFDASTQHEPARFQGCPE